MLIWKIILKSCFAECLSQQLLIFIVNLKESVRSGNECNFVILFTALSVV